VKGFKERRVLPVRLVLIRAAVLLRREQAKNKPSRKSRAVKPARPEGEGDE
jgi:hypothetical protein